MDEAALKQYDNMIKLNDLNEPTILHNLRQRFLKDEIYTYVSSILVACNPFKLLPIYTPDIMEKYKDGGGRTMPPHIYAIADNAYRNLMADFKDQAVVISGESGAGKTETMKLVLQFLADVSGRAQKQTTAGEKAESLEQQILKSNPVMEAFGNAKTTRNNNSSRFGKWTEIKFNRFGTIVGGSIINYLLEKSRIPFQAPQERNYHVFYQLLAGGEIDLDMKKRYKLRDAEEFHYMNQSGVTTVDTINGTFGMSLCGCRCVWGVSSCRCVSVHALHPTCVKCNGGCCTCPFTHSYTRTHTFFFPCRREGLA